MKIEQKERINIENDMFTLGSCNLSAIILNKLGLDKNTKIKRRIEYTEVKKAAEIPKI